ncbi:MAG: phosphoribosyl-ATP diphosphatase [Nitrospirae bacterium]|nr:phosphoribosyl-ATP diphosphatase [Nitrospirota bacterium]
MKRGRFDTLIELTNVIEARKRTLPEGSYVASLIRKGRVEILKKIGEEAFETALASLTRRRRRLISELADLWFHILVLMAAENVGIEDILKELEARKGKRRGKSKTDR